ncbi:MAG: N-6 DNA methylase, partial [bacterium]|nr:N-6 DNA methylase [bacterium]
MNYRPIIESAYNRSDWQGLLHDIFGRRVDFYSPAHRLDVGKSLIRQAWFLGAITLADGQKIGIYEAELADGVELERNRVTVRNLLAQEWRGAGFAGAFQFCYKAGSSTLRFSYASETWSFDKDGNFRRESTDTRRFTYFLGEGHRSRTALQQFQELKKSDLTLADITRAFSVEAVSARFFADYKRNYEDIVEYVTGKRMVKSGGKWQEKETGKGDRRILSGFSAFENPEKAVRDYVKKLMGRLVFLQFIQKKGWLGVPKGRAWGEGDREFLQHLFDDHASSTFIDDVLEPLFDDINTRRKGDLANAKLGRNLLVPYLNGGLFEPDGADAADFPLPPEYLRALFDFFGSYNFTIDENDPEDAEVGVDPEMLSRIFENLLEDNKDKGAFYTPKSIVEYMCRESLTAYLQTDRPDAERPLVASFVRTHDAAPLAQNLRTEMLKRLEDVKICDPAIGSGAFPMGLLKELFACRAALGDPCAAHPAELKRRIIESNIYGVDIEKGAVDIARLRFWLALVVDEETPHALPNLDFKIMQGNSLLESYEGVDLSGFARGEKVDRRKKDAKQLMLVFDEKAALGNIQKLLKDFYAVEGHAQKESLQKAIADNVRQYIAQCLGNDKETKKKLGGLRLSNDKFFLWHTWFCDVFNRPGRRGFDIIIGNPPYIKEYVCKAAFDGFREMSPYYMGKMDLWYGFACHGIDMLAPHGQLCFIAQNNWTTSTGAKKMREVISDTRIVQMVDFNEYMVFGEDNPDGPQIQTMIMQFEKDTESDEYVFDFRRLASGASRREMRQMLDGEIIPAVIYSSPRVSRAYNPKGVFAFSGDRGVFD